MRKLTSHVRKWGLLSICAAIIGVGAGAGAMKAAKQYFVQGPSATQIILLPGGNLKFDSEIARLDTRTGAVYRFRGDVDNPSVRNTWELRVAPVKEETSGLLEIQQPGFGDRPDAVFLVDVATGKTWILRSRASTNASWELVDIYRSAQFH
jgi:hypothetical protein